MNTPLGILDVELPSYLWWLLLVIPMVVLSLWTYRTVSRPRRIVSAGLRVLLVLTLVLSLAGLTRKVPVNALGVVFVVDRSASIGESGRRDAVNFINEALGHQEKGDKAGVVVFGADAQVDILPREGMSVHQVTSRPSPHHTDIAAGLRLGSATLPSDRAQRLVVLSDGEATRGDAGSQVLLTAGDELDISVVALGSRTGPDVLLEDLLVPNRVDEGAPYRIRVVARGSQPGTGTLRLYRNQQYLGERRVELSGGKADVLSFAQDAGGPGLYRYRATLEMDDAATDTIPQNNEVMGTLQVTGRPKVLYVEGKPGQSRHLARVFREQNLEIDIIKPEMFPAGLSGLRAYAAVILSDVPAYLLTGRQMEALESYVRDLGRGLMMLGGDQSFGVGGYYKSPVERALPVKMDLEDKTRFPKVGMVLALDKSCSMGGGAGSKLGMAKEASIQTSELLEERDLLGVVGFDSAASWIVHLAPLNDKRRVRETIAKIRVGGGTDIYPALSKGIKALQGSDAALKHIILLSDGVTAGGNYEKLIKAAKQRDITITSLTFGTDADRATMQDFARWGGGKYYLVTDPKTVPAIFTREVMLASRSFLIEEPFRPAPKAYSELVKGIDIAAMNTLYGYVATEPKARSVVALQVPGEYPAPLLAHWHYGLGRSVAFTSDAKAHWAKEWVGTETYTKLWSQVARWLVGNTVGDALDVVTEIREGELVVTIDAFDDNGDFLNFLKGEARVVAPDLTVRKLALKQVGPGRYEAATPVDQDGSWLAGISMKLGERVIAQTVAEAVQPYSPEYRMTGMGENHLQEIGRLGGGGALVNPADVFRRPDTPRYIPQALWKHLMWIGALLLLLDIAARRLDWTSRPKGVVELVRSSPTQPKRKRRKRRKRPVAKAKRAEKSEETVVMEPEEEEPIEVVSAPRPQADSYAGRLLAARKRAGVKKDEDESK